MDLYTLHHRPGALRGAISLAGSKSISNRALLIRALSGEDFPIQRLANARDTELLLGLLQDGGELLDAEAAGTTFRFLTAYLALQPGTQVLTGSARMKQRPIGVLVEALRQLGAQIEYLEQEGYPPLRIGRPASLGRTRELRIPASTSSQYISALLMIAPVLPQGLRLQLEGRIVSRPYIEMTLQLMAYFGVEHRWEGAMIEVPPQPYRGRPFTVEADWSAASYYYAMTALAEEAELQLNGLFADSLQGDAVLAAMMENFGVRTRFNEQGIQLSKTGQGLPASFAQDFLRCPDLAQTLAVVCAALGVPAAFDGLETLRIKETDRIAALQAELAKIGVVLTPEGDQRCQITGKAQVAGLPVFQTYEDHRMAMAFAPLALLGPIRIAEPQVVAKSYPAFWDDLRTLGFTAEAQGA
jgi:3-phosphoshikimate 1-carboxyvinyltransferase